MAPIAADANDEKALASEYSLLLLGQTGAGKSTFINCLANYCCHETLQDALGQPPFCVIPTKFTVALENMETVDIELVGSNGVDKHNEFAGGVGSSCTQNPRMYSFQRNGVAFKIVDVPGFADTGGVEHDALHFNAIIDAVKCLKRLHGILVVVKGTDARLTPELTYCLDQIMLTVHKDAVRNLMFVVTHSRGNDYHMGNSHAFLSKYVKELKRARDIDLVLSEETVFCVDNEAFRYQCAWHASAKYREEYGPLQRNYETSWEKSRSSVFKLLARMYDIQAHRVERSVELNFARTVIHCLVQPLALILTAIMRSERNRDQAINSLMSTGTLIFNETEGKVLKEPKTVCTSAKCTTNRILEDSDEVETEYSTVCHRNCHLTDVTMYKFPEPALEDCHIMDLRRRCSACGCSSDVHMHLSYETNSVRRVRKVCEKPLTHAEAEETLAEFAADQEAAQKTIKDAMVKLVAYVKYHGIRDYNTAFADRIKLELRQLEQNATVDKALKPSVQRLQKLLEEHLQEVAHINEALRTHQMDVIDAQGIRELLGELCQISGHGERIRELYEMEVRTSGKLDASEFLCYDVRYLPERKP